MAEVKKFTKDQTQTEKLNELFIIQLASGIKMEMFMPSLFPAEYFRRYSVSNSVLMLLTFVLVRSSMNRIEMGDGCSICIHGRKDGKKK
jgi:hypothetical protein